MNTLGKTAAGTDIIRKEEDRWFLHVPWIMTKPNINYKTQVYSIWAIPQFPCKFNYQGKYQHIGYVDLPDSYGHDWTWEDDDCLGRSWNRTFIDAPVLAKLIEKAPEMFKLLSDMVADFDQNRLINVPYGEIKVLLNEINSVSPLPEEG